MSQYAVIIVDADPVWPPAKFNDWRSAFRHAIKVAKSFEGIGGSPGLRIIGPDCHPGVWSVEGLLLMGLLMDEYDGQN
ncbi:hypothetical protein [Bradyrhizobium brasilense]|uniref:hypothetical protein n=1 Tax=Bradyrhizobium brasilense TaxID=1419277 RepID=UPI00115F95E3|nr:hypothetical protein [Bradyrhizobium brasilense]